MPRDVEQQENSAEHPTRELTLNQFGNFWKKNMRALKPGSSKSLNELPNRKICRANSESTSFKSPELKLKIPRTPVK
jgi:hypothetical protein